MKFLLTFLILCSLTQINSWRIFHRGRLHGGNLKPPATEPSDVLPPEEWFEQKLDHFNPSNTETWKQRFFTNDSFYNNSTNDGPIFLMIGGEGEASAEWMVQGAWLDYAKKYNALCFQLEHRYYGKSQPMPDLSTKNLRYLTSQQALADLAFFITSVNEKRNLPKDVKWIVFGGSYPGSLAAWMRMKYPHLVHGAMSASGPLLAQLDFKEYFHVVDSALASHNHECFTAVWSGTRAVEYLLRNTKGQQTITEKFKLCDPLEKSMDNEDDISNFYESLAGNFAGVVQYNEDNRVGKSARGANITISTLCDIMANKKISHVDRLAAVNNLLLNTNEMKCFDYKYNKMISEMQNISLSLEGGRQWTYQTCTEFGFFQTSSFKPHVFGDKFPVDFFTKQCVDIFGSKFNKQYLEKAIEWTNAFYGALDISVSNVVFVHGSIDPWHALGITNSTSKEAPSIYIQGTAHCANMYPRSPKDLPQLNAAREEIEGLIGSWLEQ